MHDLSFTWADFQSNSSSIICNPLLIENRPSSRGDETVPFRWLRGNFDADHQWLQIEKRKGQILIFPW
jgi:hypothetical protein